MKALLTRPALTLLVLFSMGTAPAAFARSHCFCRMESLGTIIKDFGAIGSYGTQQGHDGDCRALCNRTASAFMTAANRAAACQRTNGNSINANFAVGTRSYQTGDSYSCAPAGVNTQGGSIRFDMYNVNRQFVVEGNVATNGGVITLGASTKDVNFEWDDNLSYHNKSWTYTAKLFRDGVLVQELSARSPALSVGNVFVRFATQPVAAVRNHKWKVEWFFFQPGSLNGSLEVTVH